MAKRTTKTKPMSPELAAYWAGSISASVARDYAAGRVTTIVAGKPAEKRA